MTSSEEIWCRVMFEAVLAGFAADEINQRAPYCDAPTATAADAVNLALQEPAGGCGSHDDPGRKRAGLHPC